jgi:hypothetical protein
VHHFYAGNMPSGQTEEMKDAVYEFASFLYDLYLEKLGNDIIEDGQNNAKQENTS